MTYEEILAAIRRADWPVWAEGEVLDSAQEEAARTIAAVLQAHAEADAAAAYDRAVATLPEGIRTDEDGCCPQCGRDVIGCDYCTPTQDARGAAVRELLEAQREWLNQDVNSSQEEERRAVSRIQHAMGAVRALFQDCEPDAAVST